MFVNTTWRKRRLKKDLTISEVANYLDISYDRYLLIDKGEVKMPNKYIEKFNELINKSKGETSINRLTREEIVNEWWDEMSQKIGHGQFKINEKMRDFNIYTLRELDELLGYKGTSGMMSNYLNNCRKVGFDIKNKVYSFFENELNIQPPKYPAPTSYNRPHQVGIQKTNEYKELLEWYTNFNLKEWRNARRITNTEMVRASGLSDGTIHNILYKNFNTPCLSTMQKLKRYVENYDTGETKKDVYQTVTFTSVPVEEVPEDIRRIGQELCREVNEDMALKEKLTEKYNNKIEGIKNVINKYQYQIEKLEEEKRFYETVLQDIQED